MTSVIGVPSLVTVDWLGLDVKDWRRYASAHHAALAAIPGSEQYQHAVEVDFPYINEKTWEVIRARRENPQDDIISYLVQQEVDDRPVTDDEVFSIVDLLLAGGVGTTASLVSNTVVWLYQNPDVRQQLIDDPSLLDKAIEEFLRYFSPTQALARTVVEDTEFLGCPMKVGDRVLLAWNSANRDAQQFDDPDELDIDRWPNRHTAFGIGVHRCAGLAPRPGHGQGAARADPRADARLRRRRRRPRAVPAPGHQHRLPADPGDLHARASAADRRGRAGGRVLTG